VSREATMNERIKRLEKLMEAEKEVP